MAVTFWAAFQVLLGLATEHHASMCHEDERAIPVGALLAHAGEFGLCEFGLITTLGWVTYAAEHAPAYAIRRQSMRQASICGSPRLAGLEVPLLHSLRTQLHPDLVRALGPAADDHV
mmetsp:Transcript_88318/g.232753  ORF Transcript_88318/g.232753 Transcript_88318/m.232753 type:complete len:117 (+) Transcript_88318:2-352(+)